MAYEIDVIIKDDRWTKKFKHIEDHIRTVIETVLVNYIPALTEHVEISCVLDTNEGIRILNKKYRGKDKPTNVLSFPQTTPLELAEKVAYLCLGDIVVAYETIVQESEEQKKTCEHHLTHMLVHSCLHLLHYDHEDQDEAEEMEKLEVEILEKMSIKNPYETL